MKTIESHLPVLDKIFKLVPVEFVLEFGMGFGSTPFFLDHGCSLTSVEMQNKEWYDKITQKFQSGKFNPILSLGPYSYRNLTFKSYYDLIFVDGHGESRWAVINDFQTKTNLFVVHDTQEKSYQWDKICISKKVWERKDFKDPSGVWTSVFTSNLILADRI
jgi:hypothetical protein